MSRKSGKKTKKTPGEENLIFKPPHSPHFQIGAQKAQLFAYHPRYMRTPYKEIEDGFALTFHFIDQPELSEVPLRMPMPMSWGGSKLGPPLGPGVVAISSFFGRGESEIGFGNISVLCSLYPMDVPSGPMSDETILKSDEFSSVFLRHLPFGDGRQPIAL
jgi:hypothetical protein